MIYDLIIVGAGPAGMTAAIYAARRKMNFIIVSMDVGGQMSWSSEVENYPGTTHVSGMELVNNFQKHLDVYGIKVKSEEVVKVGRKGNLCFVQTKDNNYDSKSVIVCSGKSPKKLGVKGEDEFLSKGVNYCATCDAPIYQDKTVCVVGGGNSGLEAALFLAKYATRIYLLESKEVLGGENFLKEKVLSDKKIEVLTGVNINEIKGDKFVRSLIYEKGGEQKEIDVEGIFIEVGLVSKADFINVQKNRWGEIMLFRSTNEKDENMTSVSGIFAAGDVTDVPSKQIVVAAGEGCKAFIAASNYINKFGKKVEKK